MNIDINPDELEVDDNDIGLGDEDKNKVGGKTEWYKGEKDRTDRIALVYFNPVHTNAIRKARLADSSLSKEALKKVAVEAIKKRAEALQKAPDQLEQVDLLDLSEARFKRCSASYHEDVGYVEWPNALTAEEERVWKKLGEKKDYVFSVVLWYPTDREGELRKTELQEQVRDKKLRLLPWRFSADKFGVIRKINRGLAESGSTVSGIDLLVSCTDTKFQKMTITQAGPCLYQKNEVFKKLVLGRAVPLYEKLTLRQMTTDELRDKLGMAPAAGGGSDISDDDYSNLMSGV